MTQWRWIPVAAVEAMHADLLAQFGGIGGWVAGDLESVMHRPQMLVAYEADVDIDGYDLAAAYAQALAVGHVFADGNKRIAFVAARVFLRINNITAPPWPQHLVVERTLALAVGAITRSEYAIFLRANT